MSYYTLSSPKRSRFYSSSCWRLPRMPSLTRHVLMQIQVYIVHVQHTQPCGFLILFWSQNSHCLLNGKWYISVEISRYMERPKVALRKEDLIYVLMHCISLSLHTFLIVTPQNFNRSKYLGWNLPLILSTLGWFVWRPDRREYLAGSENDGRENTWFCLQQKHHMTVVFIKLKYLRPSNQRFQVWKTFPCSLSPHLCRNMIDSLEFACRTDESLHVCRGAAARLRGQLWAGLSHSCSSCTAARHPHGQ